MKLQDDAICDDDNMELGIANYWSNQPKNQNNIENDSTDGKEYNVDIDFTKEFVLCGEQIKITSIIQNNNGEHLSTDRIFEVFDENNNQIKYVQIINQDEASVTLKISNDGKYIGKQFKLQIVFPNLNNMVFEKMFTIRSII
jgi:hypothetical protein